MTLTPLGRAVAAASLVLLAAAYLLGYPRLAVLAVSGLVALALGGVAAARRPNVTMTREIFPTRVQRGEPLVAEEVRGGQRQHRHDGDEPAGRG